MPVTTQMSSPSYFPRPPGQEVLSFVAETAQLHRRLDTVSVSSPGLGQQLVSRRRSLCLSLAMRTELNFCEAGSKMVAKLLGGAGPFWKGDLAPVTGVGIQGQLCTQEVGAGAGGSGERG